MNVIYNNLSSSGEIQWPMLVGDLPHTLDRFRAASFFMDVELPSFLISNVRARSWQYWASLVAIASLQEVIILDFNNLGIVDLWKKSDELSIIKNDKLLLVLKELRNYETHIEFANRIPPFEIDKSKIDLRPPFYNDSYFFSPIDYDKLSELRNIKSGKSSITPNMIDWFNEYASKCPIQVIINPSCHLGVSR